MHVLKFADKVAGLEPMHSFKMGTQKRCGIAIDSFAFLAQFARFAFGVDLEKTLELFRLILNRRKEILTFERH